MSVNKDINTRSCRNPYNGFFKILLFQAGIRHPERPQISLRIVLRTTAHQALSYLTDPSAAPLDLYATVCPTGIKLLTHTEEIRMSLHAGWNINENYGTASLGSGIVSQVSQNAYSHNYKWASVCDFRKGKAHSFPATQSVWLIRSSPCACEKICHNSTISWIHKNCPHVKQIL